MFEHSAKGLKTEFVVGVRLGYKLKSTESDRFVSLISVTKCRYKLHDNNYRPSVSFEDKKSSGGGEGKEVSGSLDSTWPVPGSEIVGSAELRKHKHESKTGGKWGEQGPFPFSRPANFSRAFFFRVFPHYLRAWNGLDSIRLHPSESSNWCKPKFSKYNFVIKVYTEFT